MAIDLNTAWKQYPCKLLPNGNVVTCPVRLAFANIFKPGKPPRGATEGKYGATLLFPKGADISALGEAAKLALLEKFGSAKLAPTAVPGWFTARTGAGAPLHVPFHDGADKPQYPGFEPGSVYITALSKQQPNVINARKEAITDPALVYSGMWALVTLRAFSFEMPEKKGVSFGLQNLMKIADGEKFGGKSSAVSDFADVEVGDAFAGLGDEKSLADMLA